MADTKTSNLTAQDDIAEDDKIPSVDSSGGQTESIEVASLLRKNAIINGNFDVWQRGASFSGAAEYTADRWKAQIQGNLGTKTRLTDTPNTDSRFCLSINVTGSVTFIQLGQQIEFENFKHLLGKTVAISYYVKSVGVTTFTSRVRSDTTTVDTAILFTGATESSTALAVSTAWTKVTHTFTLTSTVKSLSIELSTGAMVNTDYFRISQVQVEPSAATPFEYMPLAQTLALCQRYYYPFEYRLLGYVSGTNELFNTFVYPVTMRATPTVTQGTAGNIVNTAATAFSTIIKHDAIQLYVIASGSGRTGLSNDVYLDVEL